jgi:hypothetical protein
MSRARQFGPDVPLIGPDATLGHFPVRWRYTRAQRRMFWMERRGSRIFARHASVLRQDGVEREARRQPPPSAIQGAIDGPLGLAGRFGDRSRNGIRPLRGPDVMRVGPGKDLVDC